MLRDEIKGFYDDYETSLIRLALIELRSKEDDSDIDISDEEIIKKRDASYEKTMRLIGAEISRIKKDRFYRYSLPRIGLAAASILLICFMGLTTAVALNGSMRVRVLEFLVNVTPEFTELSLRENDGLAFFVPAEWQGKYYPSYVPENYVTYSVDSFSDSHDVFYDLGNSKFFDFSELSESAQTNVDTENAEVRAIKIGSAEGMLVQKRNTIIIVWSNEERYFILSGNINETELIKIANSVKLIM